MENKIYGYARVSSREQNESRQVQALIDFGVPQENIFTDKKSGKNTDRKAYLALHDLILREGDTLVVKELDRLSRNKTDIANELRYFKERGVRVKILDIPTTLTDECNDEWVMKMINNILIEVMSSIAQAEREKINQRQREGIAEAKKRGVVFGRPIVKLPDNWYEVIQRVHDKEITSVKAMELLNMKKTTYYNRLKKYPLR